MNMWRPWNVGAIISHPPQLTICQSQRIAFLSFFVPFDASLYMFFNSDKSGLVLPDLFFRSFNVKFLSRASWFMNGIVKLGLFVHNSKQLWNCLEKNPKMNQESDSSWKLSSSPASWVNRRNTQLPDKYYGPTKLLQKRWIFQFSIISFQQSQSHSRSEKKIQDFCSCYIGNDY